MTEHTPSIAELLASKRADRLAGFSLSKGGDRESNAKQLNAAWESFRDRYGRDLSVELLNDAAGTAFHARDSYNAQAYLRKEYSGNNFFRTMRDHAEAMFTELEQRGYPASPEQQALKTALDAVPYCEQRRSASRGC